MLQAIAVDDENMALEILRRHAEGLPYLRLDHFFNAGQEALDFIKTNPVNLVFLDINMPGINGLEFVKMLDASVQVVFVTAHSNYAINGFDLAVTDFLLKPISKERFEQACALALSRSSVARQEDAIFVKDGHQLVRVNFDDLLYIKADDNYLSFVEKNKYTLSRMKMTGLAERLPKRFLRVHKSYIVNLDKVDRIESGKVILGNIKIPVARSISPTLRAQLPGRF